MEKMLLAPVISIECSARRAFRHADWRRRRGRSEISSPPEPGSFPPYLCLFRFLCLSLSPLDPHHSRYSPRVKPSSHWNHCTGDIRGASPCRRRIGGGSFSLSVSLSLRGCPVSSKLRSCCISISSRLALLAVLALPARSSAQLNPDESNPNLCRSEYFTLCCDVAWGEITDEGEFGIGCRTSESGSGCIPFEDLSPNDPIFRPGGCAEHPPVLAGMARVPNQPRGMPLAISNYRTIFYPGQLSAAAGLMVTSEDDAPQPRFITPPRHKRGYQEWCDGGWLCYKHGFDVEPEFEACLEHHCPTSSRGEGEPPSPLAHSFMATGAFPGRD